MEPCKKLVILGRGPHAAEMAAIVERINRRRPAWRLLDAAAADLADPSLWVTFEHDWPETPEIDPARWATLADPSCFIAPGAVLGPGCVLYPHGFVGAAARLEARVFALAGAVVNHDDRIGRRATLCSGALLAGGVEVGAGAYLGQGCCIR